MTTSNITHSYSEEIQDDKQTTRLRIPSFFESKSQIIPVKENPKRKSVIIGCRNEGNVNHDYNTKTNPIHSNIIKNSIQFLCKELQITRNE